MGEEQDFEEEEQSGGFFLTPDRLFSYFWGVFSGVIMVLTQTKPAIDDDLTIWLFFGVRIMGNALLVGILGIVLYFALKVLGRGAGAVREISQRAAEAREQEEAEFVEGVEGEEPPGRAILSRANFYGFFFGLINGAMLVYNVPLPQNSLISSVTEFGLELISTLLLNTLLIGGLGFLLGLFAGLDWLRFGEYFAGHISGTLMITFIFYYFGIRPITPDTPLVGGAVSLCLTAVPLLEGFLVFNLFSRWRKEEEQQEEL